MSARPVVRAGLTPERLADIRRVADGHIANCHRIRDHLSRNAVDGMARMVIEVLDAWGHQTI